MSSCIISNLDASLPVCFNNIWLYERLAVVAFANDAVVSGGLYVVLLDDWAARILVSIALDLYAINVAFLNSILEDDGTIVDELYGHIVNLHLVKGNKGINSCVYNDTAALADHEDVVDHDWLWARSLNVEASFRTADHGVVTEDEKVAGEDVGDYTTAHEVMKLAVLNQWIALLVKNASCESFALATASEAASLDEAGGARHLVDTGRLVLKSTLLYSLHRKWTAIQN